MIFDVCNLCYKIGVAYMLFKLAPSANSSVNSGCPNQKSDCPGQSGNNLIVPVWQ